MEVKTYRAGSLQEALQLVRHDLGPEASVLHTREVRGGLLPWLSRRQIEVTASATVNVPSRFVESPAAATTRDTHLAAEDYRDKYRRDLQDGAQDEFSLIEELCQQPPPAVQHELPDALFHLFTDLIDAEVPEDIARELVDRVRGGLMPGEVDDAVLLKARAARLIEDEVACCEPIRITPGQRKLVALVGPTGVGKTTTIAKLAANFHLREKHRVGLITVDTYRIAAVDQLRTYADIIDLPMEVVSTPREMRAAAARLAELDLILLDTAGRSPRDDVRIQELKAMLGEARADEVHLVLSSVASTLAMKQAAEQFAEVGASKLVLTKLDEATGLGHLLPLLRHCRLRLSYLTNGQNVPDDIATADRRKLARMVLGSETI